MISVPRKRRRSCSSREAQFRFLGASGAASSSKSEQREPAVVERPMEVPLDRWIVLDQDSAKIQGVFVVCAGRRVVLNQTRICQSMGTETK